MNVEDPLLEKDESENEYDDTAPLRHRRTSSSKEIQLWPWSVHFVLFTAYTIAFALFAKNERSFRSHIERSQVYSPARPVLKPEKQIFWSPISNNPFVGLPRPELDVAWHKLLEPMHIRVKKPELETLNDTSLSLADGSGYIGSLEVYHDLHCLKRIRQYIYKDHYYKGVNAATMERNRLHTEHCLEHFRDLVMCRGDIALTTFYYRNHTVTAKLLAEHECVNWQAIEDWMRERMVDLSKPNMVAPEQIP